MQIYEFFPKLANIFTFFTFFQQPFTVQKKPLSALLLSFTQRRSDPVPNFTGLKVVTNSEKKQMQDESSAKINNTAHTE